jgi:RecA/RadA recombinase
VVFKSGLEVEMQRQNVLKITTGAKGLDALLGGGIHSREITQVHARFSPFSQLMSFQFFSVLPFCRAV